MKAIIACVIFITVGCNKIQPSPSMAPGPQTKAASRQAAEEMLPPQNPTSTPPPKYANGSPAAGTYHFDSMDATNLWICATAPDAPTAWNAMIQLDGLYYPFPYEPAPKGLRQAVTEPIAKAIKEELARVGNFRFVPTFWLYQGPGQIGGVIYLPSGHTLQDILLSKGLARVDRNRDTLVMTAGLAKPLLDYWLKCERQARTKHLGFWSSHPDLMAKSSWDQSPD